MNSHSKAHALQPLHGTALLFWFQQVFIKHLQFVRRGSGPRCKPLDYCDRYLAPPCNASLLKYNWSHVCQAQKPPLLSNIIHNKRQIQQNDSCPSRAPCHLPHPVTSYHSPIWSKSPLHKQICTSYLRAFAFATPSSWNTLPRVLLLLFLFPVPYHLHILLQCHLTARLPLNTPCKL